MTFCDMGTSCRLGVGKVPARLGESLLMAEVFIPHETHQWNGITLSYL